jgi:hypothetical protein
MKVGDHPLTARPARRLERRAVLASVLAAAVVIVAAFARQQHIPKHRTIWAEDGVQFIGCAYSGASSLRCLTKPYGGFLLVVPRLGAMVAASAVSPRDLPIALTAVAAAVAALCAFVVARAISQVTGSAISGLVGGAALALVYQAGREVIGNLTNLHWVLLTTGIVLVVTVWLHHRPSALDIFVVVLGALSSALAPMLPVLAAVGWALRRPRARLMFWLTAAAAALQVAVSVAFPRIRPPPGTPAVPFSYVLGSYAMGVLSRGPFGGLDVPPDWTVTAGTLTVLMLLIIAGVLAWVRGIGAAPPLSAESAPPPSSLLAVSAVATFLVTGAVVFGASVFVGHWYNPRYSYVPSALMIEALMMGAALLQRLPPSGACGSGPRLRSLSRLIVPVVAIVMAAGFARSFALRARASDGPDYTAGYEREHGKCATGASAITIPISPPPRWTFTIPCNRVHD